MKLELSVPFKLNQYAGEIDEYGDEEPWILLDGINARFGIGYRLNRFIAIGSHIGIDWKGRESLVVAPLYGTVKINSKVSKDMKLFVEPGLGRAMELGSDKLAGYFKKISLGIESEADKIGGGLYVEFCQYGFIKNTNQRVGSICLGLFFTL